LPRVLVYMWHSNTVVVESTGTGTDKLYVQLVMYKSFSYHLAKIHKMLCVYTRPTTAVKLIYNTKCRNCLTDQSLDEKAAIEIGNYSCRRWSMRE